MVTKYNASNEMVEGDFIFSKVGIEFYKDDDRSQLFLVVMVVWQFWA